MYYTAGDGSDSGGGGTGGGDGGDYHAQGGNGGTASGMGVNGLDGQVYIEKQSLDGYWEDARIVPGAFQFAGSSDPTLSGWQPGGAGATFRVFEFNTGDEVFFTVQIPHSYKEGTSLRPHIHWTPRDRGVIENGKTVNWRLDYSIASVDGVFTASATIDLTDTCDGTDDKHQVTPSGTIPGQGIGISAMLACRVYRLAGDTWANNGPGQLPAILEFDIHFEANTNGSRQEYVK